QITIIGLGLIGSSIARGVHEYGLALHITGYDDSDTTRGYAHAHHIVDSIARDMAAAVKESDLIILATPVSTFRDIAMCIGEHLNPGAMVRDTGWVKRAAVEAIAPLLPEHVDFIPAHPIAGSEQTGIAAGRADLFKDKRVIVSPADPSENAALKAVIQFW